MFKRLLRYVAYVLAGLIILLVLIVAISVAPVDRTPARSIESYKATLQSIENLDIDVQHSSAGFSVGFGKANLTPASPLSTAGYGKRKARPYREVHDSIYSRAMVIRNGAQKVAIVSADLLIMPPAVTEVLGSRLNSIGFSLQNTYLAATHSHNSIGHWGKGIAKFIYGAYEDSVVQFIADRIVHSIAEADGNLKPSIIKTGAIDIPEAVENRLIDDGPEDSWLRVLEVTRADGSHAVLVSYAAHATCISTGTLELSRDYPGLLVDSLEQNGYDFAMFLAGAVGSHRGSAPHNDWECLSWMADKITNAFLTGRDQLQVVGDAPLVMERVPLKLSDPQIKVSDDWKLRSWLFRTALGEFDASLAVLRIGSVVMLGTPCDFSGEFSAALDSTAADLNMHAIVTSFNGGYAGYFTPEKYYDVDHYETMLMNWYAPGTGDHVRECLQQLMVAVSDTR